MRGADGIGGQRLPKEAGSSSAWRRRSAGFAGADGYGDDGTAEEVKCYDGESYAWDEREPVEHDGLYLPEHFEALVPFGYENDCGGFGDVVLDVAARKVTIERNDRFEDYTTTTYEV